MSEKKLTLEQTIIEDGIERPLLPVESVGHWLRQYLAERPHGAWRTTVVVAAQEAGIGERILRRAAKQIGVRRRGGGRPGVIWLSPDES